MGYLKKLYYKYKFNRLNKDKVKLFSLDGKKIYAKCVDVYDGDTVTLMLYIHKHPYKIKCRLDGIDTAELKSNNEREVQVAILAKELVSEKILGKTVKVHCGKWDKFGRLLGTIKLKKEKTTLNQLLLDEKLAYKYRGNKKLAFELWYGQ